MKDEAEKLRRDLDRYFYLTHLFPDDQGLIEALQELIDETELRLHEIGHKQPSLRLLSNTGKIISGP